MVNENFAFCRMNTLAYCFYFLSYLLRIVSFICVSLIKSPNDLFVFHIIQAEYRNSALSRLPMIVKDRDMLKDSNVDSDMAEEKIRRLPAGGEGWDKKMKRKRSVGAVISRPSDNDGEPKRMLHHRLTSDPVLSPSDSHGFR